MYIIHIANVYVYDSVTAAVGVLPNCQMRAVNSNHVPCLTAEKVKRVSFSCGSCSSNASTCTAIAYMQWQLQFEGVGPSKTPV